MPYLGNAPAEAYSNISYQDLTGGSGTTFTLDFPAGSPGELEVFVNNVRQEPSVAYTVSGTTLTMTGTIASTDDFYVVFQGKAQQTVRHPANTAIEATTGTFSGALSATTGTFSGATSSTDLTLSGGLYIGGTGSANYLQDYETGTWTGSIEGSASNPTTAVTETGEYVKIGEAVHVQIAFSDVSTAGATGNLLVSGLPFTANGKSNNGNVMFHSVTLSTSASGISPYLNPTNNKVAFYQSLNTSGWSVVGHHSGGNNRYVWMGLTYTTDA
jgi:hypothetical protein